MMIRAVYKDVFRDAKMLTKKPISVEHQEFGGPAAASVETDTTQRPHNIYLIKHYTQKAQELLDATPFTGVLPLHNFQFCAEVHEVSHVLGDYFDYDPKIKNWVFNHVDNIFADDNNENLLMRTYPDYARYIQIILSCLKWDTPGVLENTSLKIDLQTLFLMVRFSVIRPGADIDFVRFAFPNMLSARRGNRLNMLDASYAIYSYLETKSKQSVEGAKAWKVAKGLPSDGPTGGQNQAALDADDIDRIMNGEPFTDSANLDMLKAALDAQRSGDTTILTQGQLAGLDGPRPKKNEVTSEFYDQTVFMYPEEITELHNAFVTHKYRWVQVPAFEGELGRKRRQAFKDMKMGVERRTRVGRKQIPPYLRLGLLPDVSSSTEQFKIPYMRAVVCLLAALEGVYDVQSALAIFNSYYEVLMEFGDDISKTQIQPQASGGTVLHPLLQKEVAFWDFSGRDNILIVVTDGDIMYWDTTVLEELYALHANGVKIILIQIVTNAAITTISGAAGRNMPDWMIGFASTIENLAANIMDYLL
jgi:hypothetical protein